MDMELYDRVDRWMEAHREALVQDIVRLVRIRSVSQYGTGEGPFGPGCRAALREMLKIGEEHGFSTRNYEDYVGSLWLEGEERLEEAIGFWGHVDVVPEGDGWQYSPYEPTVTDRYVIGRGTDDNKGPTLAVLYVIQCLHELSVPLRHPLRLFVGCDEERGMKDLEYYTAHCPCPRLSIIPDSRFPVCYGEKGIIEVNLLGDEPLSDCFLEISGGTASNIVPDFARALLREGAGPEDYLRALPEGVRFEKTERGIEICAEGVSRHTASPEGGVNAILRLTQALADCPALPEGDRALLRFLCQANRDFAGSGLGIACADEVSGALTCVGSMLSLRDGRPVLHLNIRYPITADSKRLRGTIQSICRQNGCALELCRDSGPNYFPKEDPVVSLLTGLFQEMTGLDRPAFVMGGGTYARMLPRAFAYGMDGVPDRQPPEGLLLPGHGGAHGPDEAIDMDSLLRAMKIYCMAIVEVDRLEL